MSRRRQRGEGGISSYETKAGTRWLIKYQVPDSARPGNHKAKLRRGFTSPTKAGRALREALAQLDRGVHVEPSKRPLEGYLDDWLDGLRLAESTVASYRKNIRLHVKPYLGGVPLLAVTGTALTALYRQLEESGRRDGRGSGLSARTVRYVHTILHKALADAVDTGLILGNAAGRAKPPTAKQAKAPEMQPWDKQQLRMFLDWSAAEGDELHPAWLTLAMTGVRRGELLAMHWEDVDLDAGTITIRRSAGVVKDHGVGERIVIGAPKSGKARVIDVDPLTVATLRAHRRARADKSLVLTRGDALVFSDLAGKVRHPERFGREWRRRLVRAHEALGEDTLATIRLHDLRHTHATLLLKDGVPVKVVSERLGHASPMITLTIYQHVIPGMQREAAERFATLVFGSVGITGVSESHQ